ncbi:MAG: pitrilysin family protein [Bacteroidota bacterium]
MKSLRIIFIMLCIVITACQNTPETETAEFNVEFEKFTLDNGLQVIFHIDRSDPVVAVALTAHVGSARETENLTGFAHLFEHLLFLESENLGKGGLDKMSARIGGSGANGSTSRDRTNYFQTVPKDALEKMIWAEADKLGFFINTVTEPVLAKEKQVVKNEKRQGVDNAPYGHNSYVISKNLYPEGHPYSWEIIGSLEDVQNATLQDVKDFYNRWYVPNNVTLTIAGDFDTEQAKAWVEKYFSEIPRGEDIPKLAKQPVTLKQTKRLFYEDNFAQLPRLTLAWPGVHQYHPDSYALSVLEQYLSEGTKAPLYKVLVEEQQLTSGVGLYQYSSEVAGQIMLSVTAFNQTDLNDVYQAVYEAFQDFETNGIAQDDLDRIKAGQETDFYRGLSSVLGKGFQLAQYEIFAGDPGFINQDVKNILAVTADDVMRVYKTYIKDQHFVATSFVPKGQANLVLENSQLADVVVEEMVDGAEEEFDASIAAEYEKTPSSFDRSVEPPYGKSPDISAPAVWRKELDSGLKVFGIENSEVPLVQFELEIKGGLLLENYTKVGVSNLLANLMTRGTKTKTPEDLESAIESLGANINAYASDEAITITGSCLSRKFDETMALVSEILLEPRWDEKEFDLLKQRTLSFIQQRAGNPNSIASSEFAKLLYGDNHILANDNSGTAESLNTITILDLQDYYNSKMTPQLTNVLVVGDIAQAQVVSALNRINSEWESKTVEIPELTLPKYPESSTVYFYDVPGSTQSVIRFGYPGPKVTDEDFYPATVLNYRLGGGGFASQLMQQLREAKGYTYGVRSRFSGTALTGNFVISTNVRSNITYESADLIKTILEDYGKNYNENDLEVTKGYTVKSNARAFETLGAKLNMLSNISNYGLADDYAKEREAIVKALTVDDMKALAEKYIKPNQMIYLVVGDAETQMDKLQQLGFGEPVLLNPTQQGLDQ